MQNLTSQDSDYSDASRIATSLVPESSDDFWKTPEFLVWSLLIVGIFMVCFAGSIGYLLVPKTHYAANSPNSFEWSIDSLREIALVVRILGLMVFAAGLVERINIAISRLRS